VKSLKTHALFGPPLGKVWHPTPEQLKTYADIKALVPNDWTVLTPNAPSPSDAAAKAVDFVEWAGVCGDPPTVPAWHGTLLPKTDDDVWVTAGFAEFERIVALENALKERSNGKLTKEDEDRLALALVRHTIDFTSARAAQLPAEERKRLSPYEAELDRARAHKQAVGYGVFTLNVLRNHVGAGPFDAAMEAFGKEYAGKEVTAAAFVAYLSKATNKDLASFLDRDYHRNRYLPRTKYGVNTFAENPEHTLIVYGLGADEAANKEAAEELQKRIRDAWSNMTVPVMSDGQATEDDLATHHVILVGRPAANAVVAKYAAKFPVTFTPGTFRVNGDLFENPASGVIAAAPNPLAEKYSFVLVAGLSADATFHAAEHVMNSPEAEVVVLPAKGAARAVIVK